MTTTLKNNEELQVTTPTERELVLSRVFDAPRSLVFDALTKPELLKALVRTARLVTGSLRDRSARGRRLALRYASPRRKGNWAARSLSRDRAAGAHRQHAVLGRLESR
jgi:hypothetical protein